MGNPHPVIKCDHLTPPPLGRWVEMDDPKNGMREMDDPKMWYPLFVVGVDIRPWEWGGGVEMDG